MGSRLTTEIAVWPVLYIAIVVYGDKLVIIPAKEGVAKGPEKKGTTKNTKSTKKSFSFPLWPSWFKAFYFLRHPSARECHDGRVRNIPLLFSNPFRRGRIKYCLHFSCRC